MGRILDLCAEIAAEAEEGEDGIVISPDAWERFRQDWNDEDIEDAMGLVKDSLLQSELVDAADSLSARLLEALGSYASPEVFAKAVAGAAPIDAETIAQLARRVSRLEEVLELYRDGTPPDRTAFDALRRRLADQGIEAEMGDDGDEAESEEDRDE
jgi:uncharacterized protein with von Willebrand factor type A (vWA) domain